MTLTEVNYYSRKFAPLLIILSLVALILFFGVKLLFLYLGGEVTKTEVVQEQEEILNPVFGKIKPPLIDKYESLDRFKLVLDTLDGTANVAEGTGSASIYFIPQKTASFGFLTKIYSMAKATGFDTEITQHTLDNDSAIYDDGRQKMEINIKNFNFTYNYILTADDDLAPPADPIPETSILSQATSYMSEIGRYPSELSQGDKNIVYMRFDPQTKQIVPLLDSKNANIAEVDFFLPDLDGLPVVSSSYYNSPHYVMFLLGGGNLKVLRARVNFFEKSVEEVGIYPLRTGQEAWEQLVSGKGYVVSSPGDSGEIKIQKVFLAYLDPDVYQEYLQPVYVFLGESQFVAYVPALREDYILEE